ncbi:TPA: U32 family peptidase C-terminal domain-containing protein [Candidatus Gracilibacteria bacterium]|nr:U32 family peptidase C-terminal domain-containing protein [Candidatus Gracilibacteria bacterium]
MTIKIELPELLLPAGSKDKALTAFRYGADAVYVGVPMFSLRTRENNVTDEDIVDVLNFARKNNKKVYVTLNGFPHEFAIEQIKKHLAFLEIIKPDGIIFADLGVLSLAREYAPNVPKHLSVQTSTVNIPAMQMWMEMGVERVILAREMAIREVAKIHKALPTLELEYFIHGAVCMAYSGRCLLSNFTGGRDANRGACNHTCRWNYRVFDEEGRIINVSDHEEQKVPVQIEEPKKCCGSGKCHDSEENKEDILKNAKSIRDFEKMNYWEEEERQGEIIPVEEDFHGTHIMSSKDMCMIEDMQKIAEAGVCSLKVEGRNKTAYYVATIARAYRKALDNYAAGIEVDENLWDEINATANRGFFPGFLNGKPRKGSVKFEANSSKAAKEFAGRVVGWKDGRLELIVKNKIVEGAELEVVMPNMDEDFIIIAKDMKFGEKSVDVVHGGNLNKVVTIDCPNEIEVGIFIRQEAHNPGIKKTPAELAADSYAA